jgi:hypothetical protein
MIKPHSTFRMIWQVCEDIVASYDKLFVGYVLWMDQPNGFNILHFSDQDGTRQTIHVATRHKSHMSPLHQCIRFNAKTEKAAKIVVVCITDFLFEDYRLHSREGLISKWVLSFEEKDSVFTADSGASSHRRRIPH